MVSSVTAKVKPVFSTPVNDQETDTLVGSPKSTEVIADLVKTIVQSGFAGFILNTGSDVALLAFPTVKSPAVETLD